MYPSARAELFSYQRRPRREGDDSQPARERIIICPADGLVCVYRSVLCWIVERPSQRRREHGDELKVGGERERGRTIRHLLELNELL